MASVITVTLRLIVALVFTVPVMLPLIFAFIFRSTIAVAIPIAAMAVMHDTAR